jgi:hypothetical protein
MVYPLNRTGRDQSTSAFTGLNIELHKELFQGVTARQQVDAVSAKSRTRPAFQNAGHGRGDFAETAFATSFLD